MVVTDEERRKRKAEYDRIYRATHRDRKIANDKAYYHQHRDQAREYNRARYRRNRKQNLATNKRWHKRNPERSRAIHRRYEQRHRLRCYLRNRMRDALRGRAKSEPTLKLLGCSIEYLWVHLESKFKVGMTRENYGKIWHVDHIMPCAIFDLTKPEHQRRCFHFSNLQPMFARDNIRKGDKVTTNQFCLL